MSGLSLKYVLVMKKRITIDLIRHGEPEGGDILRGRINPLLTEQGWRQMRHASGLSDEHEQTEHTPPWTHIISSPLHRCRDFALSTATALKLDASIEERWQEIDYGDWDGMPIAQWRRLAADQFARFREDLSALAPPNGEDYLSFKTRITAAWESLAGLPDGSHVLVVTHGGVLRVVLPKVLGMPLNRSFPLHIPFACYSRVELVVESLVERVVEDAKERGGVKTSASLIFHNGAAHRAG